jgi:aminopeptidase
VDHLNQCREVRYCHPDFDIRFSCAGRTWINSDGRANMPSGEVFTSPVEDSVNGSIRFSFPAIQLGRVVEGIRLEVKNGEIVHWQAEQGGDVLDEVFSMPGARYFGEAAIGTNRNIQQVTRNILFDEKIGGSVHMAIGQSYYQCGGKNKSDVHWDMITDMKQGGEIFADGKLIYRNGDFLI